MFEWLIDRINSAMNNKNNPNRQTQSDEKLRSIGVLDIFGFERFEQNRLIELLKKKIFEINTIYLVLNNYVLIIQMKNYNNFLYIMFLNLNKYKSKDFFF
jgi:hypothetical protein